MAEWIWAENRGVLRVGGAEAEAFLQGLVSNDVSKAGPDRAVYAALLTPQGKYLHDFFVTRSGETFRLECEAARRGDLLQRLKRYRLRSKVDLADETEAWRIALVWGEDAATAAAGWGADAAIAADPRLAELGLRIRVPADAAAPPAGLTESSPAAYERLRRSLGVPAAPDDLRVEQSFLLESGFDELNGIDWQKGCYVGQEVTARTKYRGLVRRRLIPVALTGGAPADDGKVMQDGCDVGDLRGHGDGVGLALLKLEALDKPEPLTCGAALLTAARPAWWRLTPPSEAAAE
ncbi:MAG: folate-binding protein YgfZ [Alphaproteobacteria bacterium]|nr:folate-binding protein YgfZ [Alphaproteobacteria bacterium]MCB9928688.1 folate-binding protein YgfZ [Alphaproteobacteria bacterium]